MRGLGAADWPEAGTQGMCGGRAEQATDIDRADMHEQKGLNELASGGKGNVHVSLRAGEQKY